MTLAGRSTIEQLPEPIRDAVLGAIRDGETIDDIVALIRGMGGEASRSAVGRYTKGYAELARQQRDIRSVAEAFGKEFGEADDRQGRMMVQLMTSIATRALLPIVTGESEEEPSALELSRLAKAVKDVTGAAKLDIERESKIRDEAAKRAREQAADDAEAAGRAAGASPETLETIRRRILGLAA